MPLLYFLVSGGVTAVVKKEVWDSVRGQNIVLSEGFKVPRPIFTFANLDEKPELTGFVTGDNTLLAKLINVGNYTLEMQVDLHVPFSSDLHLGAKGEEIKRNELSFVTTVDEFYDAFGMLPN